MLRGLWECNKRTACCFLPPDNYYYNQKPTALLLPNAQTTFRLINALKYYDTLKQVAFGKRPYLVLYWKLACP